MPAALCAAVMYLEQCVRESPPGLLPSRAEQVRDYETAGVGELERGCVIA